MSQKKNYKFYCEFCDYKSNRINDFNKHESTLKHLGNKKSQKVAQQPIEHICECCNKKYKNYNALWKHKQKCLLSVTDNSLNNSISIDMVIEILKNNQELQNILISQNKQILEKSQNQSIVQNNNNSTNNSNNNNNTTNQQFNLNFFLNETCKDAMNITDFINSLKLTTSDFENTGKLGYVEGISRIIINGLKDVDVEKRPMHCTDLKRETVYIKHDNIWAKEEPDKKKLKWAVNSVARLNLRQIDIWQEENPEYKIGESNKNFEYLKYCSAALGGQHTEEDNKFMNKIMKNVLKEVVIDKKGAIE
jgi:uncharacterized protein YqcC (DUF446 family)